MHRVPLGGPGAMGRQDISDDARSFEQTSRTHRDHPSRSRLANHAAAWSCPRHDRATISRVANTTSRCPMAASAKRSEKTAVTITCVVPKWTCSSGSADTESRLPTISNMTGTMLGLTKPARAPGAGSDRIADGDTPPRRHRGRRGPRHAQRTIGARSRSRSRPRHWSSTYTPGRSMPRLARRTTGILWCSRS
jgi:hypothetical protein